MHLAEQFHGARGATQAERKAKRFGCIYGVPERRPAISSQLRIYI